MASPHGCVVERLDLGHGGSDAAAQSTEGTAQAGERSVEIIGAVNPPGERFGSEPKVIVELLEADGLQGSGCHFGDQREDVRPAIEGEAAGVLFHRIGGERTVLITHAREIRERRIERRSHVEQDEGGIQVRLVEGIEVHVGSQVSGCVDEAPAAGEVLSWPALVHVEPVLHIEPVGPGLHVVVAGGRLEYALVDGLGAVGDESGRETAAARLIVGADPEELREVRADLDARAGSAKRRLAGQETGFVLPWTVGGTRLGRRAGR